MPMPQIDPNMRKDPPDSPDWEAESNALKGQLEERFQVLEESNPEWFRYSDTLGERPIDGMMRELRHNYVLREEQIKRNEDQAHSINNKVKQNRAVAPDYTDERQQGLPEGYVRNMGRVM